MIVPSDEDILAALDTALAAGTLHMAYQPNISLVDGRLSRVEALVRWDDPHLGTIEPARFVLLAEANGRIGALTSWALTQVLNQWCEWRGDAVTTDVALNISPISLHDLDFPDFVEHSCRSVGFPTPALVLELTEGSTQTLVTLMDTLTRFRIKGIGLAIDDFGTGFSSLLLLRQLPFTEVKIDRAFVADLEHSADSALIVRSIIDLAHGLGLSATAEGVETPAQLHLLRSFGCDHAQGYLIAPPLAPQQLGAWAGEFEARWDELSTALPSVSARVEAHALGER